MDFRDTPEEASFRADLRTWLEGALGKDWANQAPSVGRWNEAESRAWSKKLYDAGYVGVTWPRSSGAAAIRTSSRGSSSRRAPG